MSKEREAFEKWIKTQPYGAESLEDAFVGGYSAATSHYQPLLAAKDAEIATLKALLEQAREGLKECAEELQLRAEKEGLVGFGDSQGRKADGGDSATFGIIKRASITIAAINAATGEK